MKKKPKFQRIKQSLKDYLNRRPHRSFLVTKKRDYKRTLDMPGYIKFTNQVWRTLWKYRRIFLILGLIYGLFSVIMLGMASQDTFSSLVNTLNSTGGDLFSGFFGKIGGAGLLLLTALSGGLSPSLSEAQQIYAGLIFIMGWLTIIWLLRNLIAGNKVRVRDGLYNSGSPILPTIMVTILMIFQALPLAIAIIAYGAAVSTGLLNGGVEAMLFWIFAALMAFLSIYWLTSTFFALIIVTLPGMYPYRAIRLASDLVIGRRLRIIYRLLWMIFILALVWAVVAIPIILLDEWLKGLWPAIKWLPVVPVVLLILNVFSVIWGSTYIYLLYRKVVDDESNADTKQT